MHAVGAEHVRQLVGVEHDGRRSAGQHEPRELVGEELRRLEMHVRVDEARNDITSGCVDDLAALVVAEPGDPAVRDRDVDVEPLAGEHGQDATSSHDDVGGLVAAGDGEASGEIGRHGEAILP